MSKFTDLLLISPLSDGKRWIIRKEFGYDVGKEGSGDTITVSVGFVTDFASVPRIFWSIFPRWGKHGNAAVIHDYLYWSQDRSKDEADKIFLEAMVVLKVPRWKRRCMYLAVKYFGGWAWHRCCKQRQ
ncbi:MAG: DUF1353 domain-containing protein [Candidatus Lokiarchaeota archaeon]|nr:DUF1353 domain-containing protein [Candidatus Lokiarchaeota archaeon]